MTLTRRPMDMSLFAERILPNSLRAVAIGRQGTSTVASKLFQKAGSRHGGDSFDVTRYALAMRGSLGNQSRS